MDNRVKELLERVRNTAETVGTAAGNTAKQAGKYAGELLDAAKLNLQIFDLNNEISELLQEIGELVYNTHSGMPQNDDILLQKLDIIDGKKRQVEELREQINILKKAKVCPFCGADCGKEDVYCKNCGERL
ncbi:MAG: zinc ribbon domain-containing protein [Oscillospiraceae bacterium]|nr:zinc ribbon domain-containing protein [Oscillospiraceae bacterium]